GSPARFPKLEECAHFHYERVQLGRIHIRLIDESKKNDCNSSLITETASCSTVTARTVAGENFIMKVSAGRSDPFLIRRSLENLKSFDSILHRCVYDRRVSELKDLYELEIKDDEQLEDAVSEYLARFSMIASDTITCGSILTWLQLDNKGRRLPVADRDTMLTINTPAVGAAYGVRKYIAQACDEISIDVGDMISVIDMPSPAESVWWRGKKSLAQKNQYEVGFFPQSCVATIGEKVPRNMPLPAPLVGSLALSPTKPVLRKHGKLIMIKSIGVESIGVTSSSSEMDAGDLLSASMNSGMIGGGSSNVMSSSMVSSASFTSSASQMGILNSADNKQMITSTGGLSITHGVSS
uniref:CSON014279 protein n=1 Tax=Culicoides sonorensis TaxID=179676 RepID=A0A336KSC0_CULSO